MFEEIKNRIADLTQTKKEIQDLYLLSNDEIEQTGLSERNMQISMELSFLNKLLQYDVMAMLPTAMINRVEVIDENGRSYVNWKPSNRTELQVQDNGRTLKVFVSQGN